MSEQLKVPPFPESVEEGTLSAWHQPEGAIVRRNEKIADIETDKIVLEVVAPIDGVLRNVQVAVGDTVTPGQPLASVETRDRATDAPPAASEKQPVKEPEPPPPPPSENRDAPSAEAPSAARDSASSPEAMDDAEKSEDVPRLSPAVRRIVKEEGVDARELTGTGRGGVVTKSDVLQYLAVRAHAEKESVATPEAPVPEPATEPAPVVEQPLSETTGDRREQRVPMTRIRARIAERLVQAQQTAAILTTFNEVNMQPVMDLRQQYRDDFEQAHGVKLGFMSFFVKAAVDALRKFPVVNATLDDRDIVYHGYYDIGVAVSTERGLVVPIVRNADQLSYADIEKHIAEYVRKAREGQLTMDDLNGGTFSITNGGIFGSLLSTPIVNPPQSAILGMHSIQPRPVAENGQVVIRPMMYLALSYDHRLVDGRDAVQFLVEIKAGLEYPARALLL